MNDKEYKKLQTAHTQAQRAADQAQGAHDAAMATLRETFEVSTIKEAEKLLKKLEAETEKADAEYDAALVKFEDEWDEYLQQNTEEN